MALVCSPDRDRNEQRYDGGMLVGDRDRDRAAAVLREHYAGGRLTLDELSERLSRVVAARSGRDIVRAFWGLPILTGLMRHHARARMRRARRAVVLAVASAAYVLFSFTLLIAFAVTLLVSGATTGAVVGFLVVWLVPTFLLARLWRRGFRATA
jgi:hypothetical protein